VPDYPEDLAVFKFKSYIRQRGKTVKIFRQVAGSDHGIPYRLGLPGVQHIP
jgi:hypothetical protein